jgi:CRISPR-associated protein Csm2
MINFYKDKNKKIIDPKLFSDIAEQWADTINHSGNGRSNKRTQIRKFYDEVVRYNNLAKGNPKDWDNILPFINMLIAKATYALGRNLVTREFVDFIKESVNQVQDEKDMDVFAGFFEAFMGFYKLYER